MAGGLDHRDAHGTVTTLHGRSYDDSAPIERGWFGSLPWSWAQAIEFFTAS